MRKGQAVLEYGGILLLTAVTVVVVLENQVSVPDWMQVLGRMHPMVLHFPIVLVILMVLAELLPDQKHRIDTQTRSWLLAITFFVTVLTAFFGLILSVEDTYAPSILLSRHKWSALVLCYAVYLLYVLKTKNAYRPVLVCAATLVIITGHMGASLTHGKDFLIAPLLKPNIADPSTVFGSAIQPIFNSKCTGCHNPNKLKGGLDLTTYTSMIKGGENGPVLSSNSPPDSELLKRLVLPLDHDDHMPPAEKQQLDELELNLIHQWVLHGARENLRVSDLTAEDSLRVLVNTFQQKMTPIEDDGRSFSDPKLIKKLNNPRRSVIQMSPNSPDLEVSIFVRSMYTPSLLEELRIVKENIVHLNVSGLPITDQDLSLIGQFTNLRKLNLNKTDLLGDGIPALESLSQLQSLSLTGTLIQPDLLSGNLAMLTSLQDVYIWNTLVTKKHVETFRNIMPAVRFHLGYSIEDEPPLKLSPPQLINDGQVILPHEKVGLVHGLGDIDIRYTLDGSEPDSLNALRYTGPFHVDTSVVLKARAFKKGWLGSPELGIKLFKAGLEQEITLITAPSAKYSAYGPATLTNRALGNAANFGDGISWLGFQGKKIEILIDMGANPPAVSEIAISYGIAMPSGIMAPTKLEVFLGDDPKQMEFAGITRLAPADSMETTRSEVMRIHLDQSGGRYAKLIIHPLDKLSDWHPLMEYDVDPWVFVDEVFVYGDN